MQTWACGHKGEEGRSRLCPHLINAEDALYARVLRGRELESDLCCPDCATRIKNGDSIEWLHVCAACVESHEEDGYNLTEWIGQPEIKERLLPFNATLRERALPKEVTGVVALYLVSDSQFVGFGDEKLFLVDETGMTPICAVSPPQENGDESRPVTRIHLSSDGNFAALCHDFGRYGVIVDLQKKRVTMNLDKGAYRYGHTPFPAVFFVYKGRTLLVHATDWNRVDISDPVDGTLISRRDFPSISDEEKLPEHYSGFWHGQLHVSEDSQWIADDQWRWGPAGEVTAWNLVRWMEENVWESEDGQTRQRLCQRLYLWNIPVAWVDNHRVAVWGIGYDDEAMLSGARVFDVSTGKETAAFAGPSKKAFFGGEGSLFSIEEDGLHIWDANNGERLGRIEGFQPPWQRGDFLIELKDNVSRSWNWRMHSPAK